MGKLIQESIDANRSSALAIWVYLLIYNADLGLAMADNLQKYLQKEGYPPLILYNRTTSRADPIKDKHVKVVESVEEAVKPSDIIFSCVSGLSVRLT
jgi:hypothetical protein